MPLIYQRKIIGNKMVGNTLLEIKESLLIMRDKPSLNRNINSAPLHPFDKVSCQVLVYFTLVYLT